MMMMMMMMMEKKPVLLRIAQFCICLLFKLEKYSVRKAETTAWGGEVRPEHVCLHL